MTVKLFGKITHVIKTMTTLINIRINPLIDNEDGVRRYNFQFWNRSCLQFWDEQ